MRPVLRSSSPQEQEFEPYTKSLPYLVSRLGSYCSYCERHVQANLAVEHIQPKGLAQYAHLTGTWTNFLLGCVNCNSTKLNKDVVFEQLLLPDRDNTALAFDYPQDGSVVPSEFAKNNGYEGLCKATLKLTGLDKVPARTADENDNLVALERVSQRMQTWLLALDMLTLIETNDSPELRTAITKLASKSGFFSIWMKAFQRDRDMRLRILEAYPGTRESGCFDQDGLPATPHPNNDQLPEGGKI
jgi:hypothetical protein